MFASILSPALKFNPHHDPKTGKFTTANGKSMPGAAKSKLHGMFDRIGEPDGGFTYQPTTGVEPSEGYALSPYPERSFAKPAAELKFKDVAGYYLDNQEVFEQEDHFIGGWHDPATGMVFLDVSVVKSSEEEATQLALEKDQIAYFDLKNFKSVTVNPDAKSGVLKEDENGKAGTLIGQALQGFGNLFARKAVQKADRAGADRRGTGGSQADGPRPRPAQLIAQDFSFSQVFKANPYHDKLGRFTTGHSANFVSMWGLGYAKAFAANQSGFSMEKYKEGMKQLGQDPLNQLMDDVNALSPAPMTIISEDGTQTVLDPKEHAKQDYKKALTAFMDQAKHVKENYHNSLLTEEFYKLPPQMSETMLKGQFKNLVDAHLALHPDQADPKDITALELAQTVDLDYRAKFKLGLPLMDWEQQMVSKDLEEYNITMEEVGGGWVTPTDLGKYGKKKLDFTKGIGLVAYAAKEKVEEYHTQAKQVADHYIYASAKFQTENPLTEGEEKLKALYDEVVAVTVAANPDQSAEDIADVVSHLSNTAYPQLPPTIKKKLGMKLTDADNEKMEAIENDLKLQQHFHVMSDYQKAMEQVELAKIQGNKEAYALANMNAKEMKNKAKALGAEDYEFESANENAKGNAEYKHKQNKALFTKEMESTYNQIMIDARKAGAAPNFDVLEQNANFSVEHGHMTRDEADQIIKDLRAKEAQLKAWHLKMKAMIPEAKTVSEDFANETFKTLQQYGEETKDFYTSEKAKFKSMSQAVQAHVVDYTSSGYRELNKAVGKASTDLMYGRKPEALTGTVKAAMQAMDKATSEQLPFALNLKKNFPTKYMMEQFGITHAMAASMDEEALNKTFVGKLYKDHAFGSTSTLQIFSGAYSSASSEGSGAMWIRAPAGTKGLGVDSVSANEGEREIILARGTTYLIRSVKKDSYGAFSFEVDIIGQFPDDLD